MPRRLLPFLPALLLDAGYLFAWTRSPVGEWVAWALVAGLVAGAVALARWNRRHASGEAVSFPWFCLPVALPATSVLAAFRRRRLWAEAAAGSPDAHRRAGLCLLLVTVIGLSASGILGQRVVDPVAAPLDRQAEQYVDRALVQAGAAYVGARVLERVIAVAGDISVSIVFIEGRPGQVLEPLRELLERFSTVILVALGSLTLQKVLLQLNADIAVSFFVTAALGAMALALLATRPRWSAPLYSAAGLLFGTAVFLRLLLPLSALAVSEISTRVLADRREHAAATIERAAGRIGMDVDLDGNGAARGADRPLKTTLGNVRDSAQALANVDEEWLRSLFDAFVDLVAVFVIETIVAPLAVLFLLWRLWLRLVRTGPPAPRFEPDHA